MFNPLNAELNPIRHLLALAGAHHFVDVSRIRVKYLVEPTRRYINMKFKIKNRTGKLPVVTASLFNDSSY
jgi:hypothetical protein